MNSYGWLALLLAGGGAVYLSRLKNTGEKITVSISRVDPPTATGGKIGLNIIVAIDNPTDNSYNIKTPNLKALYNGDAVGNSIPDGRRHDIKANGRTTITGINLQVPFSNLPGILLNLVLGKTTKIALDIEISVEVGNLTLPSVTQHYEWNIGK